MTLFGKIVTEPSAESQLEKEKMRIETCSQGVFYSGYIIIPSQLSGRKA
jgi:hypothetical protein